MKALLTLLMTLFALTINGQEKRPWEQLLAEVMTAEDIESAEWEDTYGLLCELEQQPINLNTASREDLESLPFLSDQQVEGIMEYLHNYGPMKSMNELRMIRALDYVQTTLLSYFTCIEENATEERFPPIQNIMKYGRQELMADARAPIYKEEDDDKNYLGYSCRHWLRYQFSYRDNVKAGLVGSQDAGEPFLANKNTMGYDFYSYYLQVKHLGRVENLVVGKYKLSTGMGLVLNNSFGLGKLAMLQQLGRNANTVRPHSSRSQTGYFQGAAATLRLSTEWLLTAFASYRPFDATLNADGTIRTIVTSGYHRTPTEMAKKNNSHATDAGAHIAYRKGGLHAGATVVYTHTDRELCPDTKTLYRRHNAQGNNFLNMSADYGYRHPRFAINGETAMNRDGALATINSLSVNAANGLNVMLLQRFYSYRYTALYARSMAEGGHVQNESGVYLGATWQLSPRLRLQAYTDYAYFAWARYQVSQSSYAWDNLLTATYNRGPWTVTGRYRLHLRQKDNEAKTALTDYTEHRGRLALGWQGGPLTLTTQADAVSSNGDVGYMVGETLGCEWRTWKLSAHAAYFHTDSYDSRLYVYERGPLYSFSFPAYYDEGVRLALMAQTTISRRLTLTAKTGYTRDVDLELQVRWKF